MAKTTRSGPAADRYVEETLALIAERGGSQDVNLREISRRAGYAHTNVYNYFTSFDDLCWEAFRRTLQHYATALSHGLDDALAPLEYLRQLITNLAGYPQQHPGLYRFIGSDPIDIDAIPNDILDTVATMKQWLIDAFTACTRGADPGVAADACTIVYAYIDGETFNLINGRVVPGEDIGGRIVENAMRLFTLLTRPGNHALEARSPRYPPPIAGRT